MSEQKSAFEERLYIAIAKINDEIKDLLRDKSALERQLIIARRENTDIRDVSRKNSIDRVMIEKRVILALGGNKTKSTYALYKEAKEINFNLKENTFRTQLHRMKNKGIIEKAERNGKWRLPSKK